MGCHLPRNGFRFSKFAGGNVQFPGSPDGFVAKLNSNGSALVWASFLGGTALDQANTIALDAAGDVWVNGIAPSADFPAPDDTVAAALALDPGGVLHAAGDTGLVSAISSGGKPGPRIFGLASAAGGSLAGRVALVELISIYCLDLACRPGLGDL